MSDRNGWHPQGDDMSFWQAKGFNGPFISPTPINAPIVTALISTNKSDTFRQSSQLKKFIASYFSLMWVN